MHRINTASWSTLLWVRMAFSTQRCTKELPGELLRSCSCRKRRVLANLQDLSHRDEVPFLGL